VQGSPEPTEAGAAESDGPAAGSTNLRYSGTATTAETTTAAVTMGFMGRASRGECTVGEA